MMTLTTTRPANLFVSNGPNAKRAPLGLARRPMGRPVLAKAPLAQPRRFETSPRTEVASRALTVAGAFATTVFAALLMFCRGIGPNGYLCYATIALGMTAWLLRDASSPAKAACAR
jgi:hypothetical protein